jgi:hypothetical protein
MTRRTFIADNPKTGSQVLITMWIAEPCNIVHLEIATRPNSYATWSPPLLDFKETE